MHNFDVVEINNTCTFSCRIFCAFYFIFGHLWKQAALFRRFAVFFYLRAWTTLTTAATITFGFIGLAQFSTNIVKGTK
jgi:hypothetical protein